MVTLKQLIEEHPEWSDLPIAIYRNDGDLDYIGESGLVYPCKYYETDFDYEKYVKDKPCNVLVFAGN